MALKSLKPRLNTLGKTTTQLSKKNWGKGRGGRPWRRKRLEIFKRDKYTCQSCGVVTTELECDHIINTAQGGTDNASNLQSLCKTCHKQKTLLESGCTDGPISYTFMPEWLQPVPKLTIVFGPSGSGKTTYVKEQATYEDVVLDLDHLISDISGKPLYVRTQNDYARAVNKRNSELLRMSIGNLSGYLILTGNSKTERQWWIDKLRPCNVIIMDTSQSECIRRITSDPNRPTAKRSQQIESLSEWFQ